MNLKPKTLCLTAILLATLLFAACSSKKYAYIKDAPRDEEMAVTTDYTSTLLPDDLLYIHVNSKTPQSVVPFNQETNQAAVTKNPEVHGYSVSYDGDIIFPVLGRIHAEGMTTSQLAAYIEGRLVAGRYVKDPQVTVTLMNFRVTVIGEVAQPQQIHMPGSRLTIFEALAICGDVTMDGMRDRVTIIRSKENEHIVDTVDLTSREILNSPYYYLHQNDIVYVEPTKRKKRIAWRNEDWPKYLTTGVAAVRIAYLTYYRYVRIGRMN
jgi:polysaccharide export outer membrane protein